MDDARLSAAMDALRGTTAGLLLARLGDSPLRLSEKRIRSLQRAFPIPREQTILWADAEFDLRPSGIVCTCSGVFIRSNVAVLQLRFGREDPSGGKPVLYYYRWDAFRPEWFTGDDADDNRALLVEGQCARRFVEACRALAPASAAPPPEAASSGAQKKKSGHGVISAGSASALESAGSAVFAEQKARANTLSGHGEMAEEAITMADRLHGLDAAVTGRDNAKNGADRRIGTDIFIQTKYHKSASSSLESSFDSETGMYRYMHEGSPMQLEVPSDQYPRVLEGFRQKIAQGKVEGVSDPELAESIVREGRLTYAQAVNLTRPGTLESLLYDAASGTVICSCAFGLSFAASVFLNWRRSRDMKQAIRAGLTTGVQMFGLSFLQHMLISQLSRTAFAASLLPPAEAVVSTLDNQAASALVNAVRTLGGEAAIQGASAYRHLARIMRSTLFSSALTFAVFSIPDTCRLATRRISAAQYAKNLSVLSGSIAGGTGGAIAAGAAAGQLAGTAVTAALGTAIGVAGGFVGGSLAAMAVDAVGDLIHEDDADAQLRLFNAVLSCMIGEHLLDADEIEALVQRLDAADPAELRRLFTQVQRAQVQEAPLRDYLLPHVEAVTAARERFSMPGPADIFAVLSAL